MSTNGVCEYCYDSGYMVDMRRDNEQEIWLWSNKRLCPHCKIAKQL